MKNKEDKQKNTCPNCRANFDNMQIKIRPQAIAIQECELMAIEACQNGDREQIQALLNEYPSFTHLDYTSAKHGTLIYALLCHALYAQQFDIINLLIQHAQTQQSIPASSEQKTCHQLSQFGSPFDSGIKQYIEQLAQNGQVKFSTLFTARYGDKQSILALVKQYAMTDDFPMKEAIFAALKEDNLDTFRLLLKYWMILSVKDTSKDQHRFLYSAVQNASVNCLKHILDQDLALSMLDSLDGNTCSPLIIAIQNQNIEITKLLIEYGASINGAHRRENPLDTALSVKNEEIAIYLVERGATLNLLDPEKNLSFLDKAKALNFQTLVRLMIEKGAVDYAKHA